MIQIIKIIIAAYLLIVPVAGLRAYDEYGYNECELIAKDFQEQYGGSLVFIQPLTASGAFDFGDYSGHFLNYITIDGRGYYMDYQNQRILFNKEAVLGWYGKNAIVYNFAYETTPFPIKWHY